ncbi:hypothetical protein FVE85_7471 [Porphyridium purpureum]|uniref:3'-5' exonuclease domain-containing protein n=1 Tax=Porphyridium purpureum TaxID=35688 RepID=A0A5J4Z809_PORPP|nr:hypothetical protein FVE85_7471 [Porphyridium purpureum]|eukprot:POR6954..scf295_1
MSHASAHNFLPTSRRALDLDVKSTEARAASDSIMRGAVARCTAFALHRAGAAFALSTLSPRASVRSVSSSLRRRTVQRGSTFSWGTGSHAPGHCSWRSGSARLVSWTTLNARKRLVSDEDEIDVAAIMGSGVFFEADDGLDSESDDSENEKTRPPNPFLEMLHASIETFPKYESAHPRPSLVRSAKMARVEADVLDKFSKEETVASSRENAMLPSAMRKILALDVESATIEQGGAKLPALVQVASAQHVVFFWLDKWQQYGTNPPSRVLELMQSRDSFKVGVGITADARQLADFWNGAERLDWEGFSCVVEVGELADALVSRLSRPIDAKDPVPPGVSKKIRTRTAPIWQVYWGSVEPQEHHLRKSDLKGLTGLFLGKRLVKSKLGGSSNKKTARRSHWRANEMGHNMTQYAKRDVSVVIEICRELQQICEAHSGDFSFEDLLRDVSRQVLPDGTVIDSQLQRKLDTEGEMSI